MHRRVLTLSFLQSFALTLYERGIYFFLDERFGFTPTQNLLVAVAYGVVYVAGAMLSHRLADRLGERRAATLLTAAAVALGIACAAEPTPTAILVAFPLAAFAYGAAWPVFYSYGSAGLSGRGAIRGIGRLNLSWAVAIPVALAVTGPILEAAPRGLFALAAFTTLIVVGIAWSLPAAPARLPDDHPDHPPASEQARLRRLLASSRWTMLMSFAMVFLIAPLLPEILLRRLGLPLWSATLLAAGIDLARVVAFAVMQRTTSWRHSAPLLVLAAAAVPVGFYLVLLGGSVGTVLLGSLLLGASNGVVYFAGIYHAIVLSNASVDAGGKHEGLVGVSLTVGPGAGLMTQAVTPVLGAATALAVVTGPIVALPGFLALRALVPPRHDPRSGEPRKKPPRMASVPESTGADT